ncbi:hypothetical protein CLM62_07205 [Streptomyces sp. SA15]|uniref:hypothetical protein n=1 Tax=Streptomyces sp. SA15 TaxID=934019 RepID=UPI000BB0495D|nr:hypothetical protein [Streptomyces sp. SA15]PAZ16709.1 hypothetical protein CLM62_07205 [Streptomyces sp. SA15]
MLRSTWTHGRRSALIGASAAVVCLGGALAACGGGGDGGYVATGAAGGPPRASGTAVTPTGAVTLVPLDEEPTEPTASAAPRAPAQGGTSESAQETGPSDSFSFSSPPRPSAEGAESGRTTPRPSPSPTAPTASPTARPGGPADLTVSAPARKPTDKRWCEDVTVAFHNTGGSAVRSGTITFATHVIGALGVDWATIESTEKLPAPIEAGARKEKTWTVCVEAWRVPLGMRVETRDVAVRWE